MGMIDPAPLEAETHGALELEGMVPEMGEHHGGEMDSVNFAWTGGGQGAIPEGAERKINRISGKGKCLDCETEFSLQQYYDPCPDFGEHCQK